VRTGAAIHLARKPTGRDAHSQYDEKAFTRDVHFHTNGRPSGVPSPVSLDLSGVDDVQKCSDADRVIGARLTINCGPFLQR